MGIRFTAIHVHAVSKEVGPGENREGHAPSAPLDDITRPVEAYCAHVKSLFASRPWHGLVPDLERRTLTEGWGDKDDTAAAAARSEDGALAIVYLPAPRGIEIDLARFSGPVNARWFDPTDGSYRAVDGSPFANRGKRALEPPPRNGSGDPDIVLVLERN